MLRFFVLLLLAGPALAQSCLVTGISDGDTLKARCGAPGSYEQITVRLAEIDAPEKGQPFGQRSKEELAALCHAQEAVIRTEKTDRYGRSVARVQCRGQDASEAQVRAGMAWAFTRYLTDPTIAQREQEARAARAGLWRDAQPVAPWEWRAAARER